jgi:prepilin-type processing-associated H-X9-DG protein
VIQPYVKSTHIFQCGATQKYAPPLTDYFYNSRAAGVAMGAFDATAQTILTGDGDDDAPTWVSLSQMPASWKTDQKSPAWRHLDGANYGFADGHVKWLKASQVNSTFSDKGYPTFALAKSP